MKRERKLLILTGVLAVCIAGAVVISRMDFEEKMTGTQTVIVDADSSDVTYLSWNYGEDQPAFVREDGVWSYESDDKMSVDQDLLDEIAENLSDITSDKMVEEVQSLSVYGLSDPSCEITIKTSDETWEIAVGDETFSDGEVYISIGDDYVYLTDSGLLDDISYTLLDCVQKEEIPQMEHISAVTVDNSSTVSMVYKENAGYCYSDAYTYYLKDGDQYQNLDNEETEDTFTALTAFSWEECVDYYAEDTELEDYGLKEPAAAVAVTYQPAEEDSGEDETDDADEDNTQEELTFEYQVGTADDAYFAKLKDSNIVYRISEDVYLAAVNASYENLKPDELILLDWSTVDSIEAEIDGSVYTLGIETDEDGEYTYTYSDSEIDLDGALDQLSALTVSGEEEEDLPEEEPEPDSGRLELKLTFHRNTEENQTVELEFYQYDGSYCVAVLNGEEMNYTDRSPVIDLKEEINSVILDSSAKG